MKTKLFFLLPVTVLIGLWALVRLGELLEAESREQYREELNRQDIEELKEFEQECAMERLGKAE